MPRRHGFQWPLSVHQVGVGTVLVTLVGTFFALLAPTLEPKALRVALQAGYAILAAATGVLLVVTTAIDAADAPQPTQRSDQRTGFYCPYCERAVARGSKHCRRCDKCVAAFDHHCIFLNNCIGSRNYRWFLALLVVAIAVAATHCAAAGWLLGRSVTAAAATRARLDGVYSGRVSVTVLRAVTGVSGALAGTVLAVTAELLGFHLYLMRRGMTTYDSIMARRAAKLAAVPKPAQPQALERVCAVLRCRGAKVVPVSGEDAVLGGIDPACGGLGADDVSSASAVPLHQALRSNDNSV